jgi:hypothetical protein
MRNTPAPLAAARFTYFQSDRLRLTLSAIALRTRPLLEAETLGDQSSLLELLLNAEYFTRSVSFHEQCDHGSRILHTEHDRPVPCTFIDALFGVDKGTVRNHAKKYLTDLNIAWRQYPRKLSGCCDCTKRYRCISKCQSESRDESGSHHPVRSDT